MNLTKVEKWVVLLVIFWLGLTVISVIVTEPRPFAIPVRIIEEGGE